MDPQPSIVGIDAAARRSSLPAPAAVRPPLVIVGASCRAAAASAAAAGWHVHAADLFDDIDLATAAAVTRRADRYPHGLVEAVAAFPRGPWCYTGAIENHPEIIDRIAAVRPLAANDSRAVRRIRTPAALASILALAGVRTPETHATPVGLPTDGSFLRKPLASAGGRGIVRWTPHARPTDRTSVWQRFATGPSLSAVLTLAADRGHVMGVTRQIVGAPWCRAPAFAFSGSVLIPPANVTAGVRAQFEALAAALATHAGLRGVAGVDAILESDGRLTVLEVNPRPTASAELIERAEGTSIMGTHLEAFGHLSPCPSHAGCPAVWSKAILFAARATPVDDPMLARLAACAVPWTDADGRPALADIPRPGQVLRAGAPVLTVFARGDTEPESAAFLRRRIGAIIDLTG